MKKVMWLFGNPSAGRTTLINNIIDDKLDVRKPLGIKDSSIKYTNIPYNSRALDDGINTVFRRKDNIIYSIDRFSKDEDDVLLLKGEFPEYSIQNDSLISIINNDYKSIKQEILLLSPNDLDILYKRIQESEWFQKDLKESIRKFPIDWLRFASTYLKEAIKRYEDVGYTIYDVDTTDGYIINKR